MNEPPDRETFGIPGCPGIDVQRVTGTAGSRYYMLRIVGSDALLGDLRWYDLGHAVAAGARLWTQLTVAQQTAFLGPDFDQVDALRQLLSELLGGPVTTAGQEAG